MHPELQSNTERALVACRLWTHIGFIGATVLAAGLLQLFNGEGKWFWALALALLGGVLAAMSWRRALTILEHADWASTVATDAPGESTSRLFRANGTRRDSPVVTLSAAIEPEIR